MEIQGGTKEQAYPMHLPQFFLFDSIQNRGGTRGSIFSGTGTGTDVKFRGHEPREITG